MDRETQALLLLSLVPGIGPRHVTDLIQVFGSASAAIRAEPSAIRAIPGFGPQLVRLLTELRGGNALELERQRLAQLKMAIVARGQTDYPAMLNEIPDPPTVLYRRGEFTAGDPLAIAMVGTRHASAYGRRVAERLASSLSRAGVTIVSGLARGIDAVVHRATLDAGGRTIAVLANGLQHLYPPEHAELAKAIARQGALVSEAGLDAKPRRGAFPRRNRIISGMSLGVVVIEATPSSGALITARHAMEQGREVFAVPGPIDTRNSRGCHQLIRDGAKLVETVEDVLDEIGPLALPVAREDGLVVHQIRELQLNPQEQQVLKAITGSADGSSVDHVIRESGLPVQRVLATLTVLETRHLIRRIAGDRVTRL
jgi:DNA processing protein